MSNTVNQPSQFLYFLFVLVPMTWLLLLRRIINTIITGAMMPFATAEYMSALIGSIFRRFKKIPHKTDTMMTP